MVLKTKVSSVVLLCEALLLQASDLSSRFRFFFFLHREHPRSVTHRFNTPRATCAASQVRASHLLTRRRSRAPIIMPFNLTYGHGSSAITRPTAGVCVWGDSLCWFLCAIQEWDQWDTVRSALRFGADWRTNKGQGHQNEMARWLFLRLASFSC